jgi:hypothetical protein
MDIGKVRAYKAPIRTFTMRLNCVIRRAKVCSQSTTTAETGLRW